MWSASSKFMLALWLLGVAPAWAAETSAGTSTTQLVVKLATPDVPAVRARFEHAPPTIVLEFPESRVMGTLPERSVMARGAVQELHTLYASSGASVHGRWIQALRIQLRGPYDYEVHPHPGRILVTISHPAALSSEDLEIGLAGGIIVSGMFSPAFSERFRAMQEALTRAQPQPVLSSPAPRPAPLAPQQAARQATASRPPAPPSHSPGSSTPLASAGWWWALGAVGMLRAGGLLWRWRRRRLARAETGGPTPLPASLRIIDQLVWRAFERQGYQLIQMVELGEPLGLMRLISRDGRNAALLCMGNGTFFEKSAVEQFAQASRRAQAEQGFLVTAGSFTIPAQRLAAEHQITLIGREQLIELLSEGAMSETYAKQLLKQRGQLDEAKQTLSQYAEQLDTIRRQRNEASWFLGEARARRAALETQAGELAQLVTHWQAQADQWRQATEAAKKQLEESQWYLGEARAALAALQQDAQQLRDHVAKSQQTVEDIQRCLDAERAHRRIVEAQLAAVSANGRERREHARLLRADIAVEAHRDGGEVVFRGTSRDLSRTGIGLIGADEPQMGLPEPWRFRLHVPGAQRPIEATGRLIWHRRDAATGRTAAGCKWLEIPAESRELLERTLTTTG